MVSDCLHPLLRNLNIASNSLDSLQYKRLYIWVFEKGFAGALRREELGIELRLFWVDNTCWSEVADLVTKPSSPVVTAFERADGGVFMGLDTDLYGKIIGFTAWIGKEYLVTFG